jgi:surface protein
MSAMILEYIVEDGGEITLPLSGTVNVNVNWGDGSEIETFTTTGNKNHTYINSGTYTVSISGTLTRFGSNSTYPNANKLYKVLSFGEIGLTSLSGAFRNCSNLIEVPSSLPLLTTVTNLSIMFAGATSFNDSNIINWDVSSVTTMTSMFNTATSFNQNIGNWNVSSVTTMFNMFNGATLFNKNIGNWNVSNVTTMIGMFSGATSFNQNIGNWNVSNVISMTNMFNGATSFNQNIGNWNVSNVIDMDDMFNNVTLSISNYNNLLIGWSNLNLQNNINFNAGNSKYSSQAIEARSILIDTYSWNITDGGLQETNLIQTTLITNYYLNTIKYYKNKEEKIHESLSRFNYKIKF